MSSHIELTGTFSCRHCNKSLSIKFMLRRILKSECPKCRTMHNFRFQTIEEESPFGSSETYHLIISFAPPARLAKQSTTESRKTRRVLRDKVRIAQSKALQEREALKLLAELETASLDAEVRSADYEAAMLEMDKAMKELKAELKQKRLPN